jgi:hypothetical protein
VELFALPFDLPPIPPRDRAKPASRRLALLAVIGWTGLFTLLAVGWKVPFTGTAALLTLFVGSAWLGIAYWRAAFRR